MNGRTDAHAPETVALVGRDRFIIGESKTNLTPLDAAEDRLKDGGRWIQSDVVCEVLP